MKILITSDWYTAGTNGVIISVNNLRSELIAAGHDVRVLSFSPTRHSYVEDGAYCIGSLPFPIYPNVRATFAYHHPYVKELISWKPDVIHSQCEFFSMPFAKRISRLTGAPIVHTYHTLYEQYLGYAGLGERFGKWLVRVFTKKTMKKVALVIAPTAKTERILQGYDILPPICVLPSGIDLSQHRKRITPEQRASMRQSFGIAANARVMVYLGRLGAEKSVDELLRMFAKIKDREKDLFLLIVGDGPAMSQLRKESEALGLEGRAIFTGMVESSRVQEYYQLGDVFVCASTSEAQGLTYVEAAANGLPLLCREDLCLGGVLLPGENGFAYNDEDGFFAALTSVFSEDGWRTRAGKRSEEISLFFDKAAFGKHAEEAYRSVLPQATFDEVREEATS